MPLVIGDGLNKTSQWIFGSSFLNKVFGSCVFIAIAISLVMVLLIMIMYPAKRGTSIAVVLKMFIYMTFVTLMLVFLHDGVTKKITDENTANRENQVMFDSAFNSNARDPVYGNSATVITPNIPPSQSQAPYQAQPYSIPQANPQQAQQDAFDDQLITGAGDPILGGYSQSTGGMRALRPPPPRRNRY